MFMLKILLKVLLNILAAVIGGVGCIIAVFAKLSQGLCAFFGGLVLLSSLLAIMFEAGMSVVLFAIFGGIGLATAPFFVKYFADMLIDCQSTLHDHAMNL